MIGSYGDYSPRSHSPIQRYASPPQMRPLVQVPDVRLFAAHNPGMSQVPPRYHSPIQGRDMYAQHPPHLQPQPHMQHHTHQPSNYESHRPAQAQRIRPGNIEQMAYRSISPNSIMLQGDYKSQRQSNGLHATGAPISVGVHWSSRAPTRSFRFLISPSFHPSYQFCVISREGLQAATAAHGGGALWCVAVTRLTCGH